MLGRQAEMVVVLWVREALGMLQILHSWWFCPGLQVFLPQLVMSWQLWRHLRPGLYLWLGLLLTVVLQVLLALL
jgi:hypothetical protein